jgi:hypothetical protein
MIAASAANLADTTDDTIIIAGHGKAVGTKSELEEFQDMLVTIRERVATLKRQGRSGDETVAAKPTAAFDAKFGFRHRSRVLYKVGLRRRVTGCVHHLISEQT